MKRKVKISKTTEKKLEKLFDYLLQNWSQKVKTDFIKKLDKSVDLITSTPEIFPESEKQVGLHKCVITKQITLYYRFDAETVYLITIFDTRQHPEKLRGDLK
ncbi:type II toxin-antitoxin system RelE/ParE family toxin [Dokdonia ponticola]|uniref:Type II toxin-antitoxin system RelE/ParE family toxin n=1 Tax=Dokdonia ponticola TaxID=2041041 RepID=A0ABV9HS14_9FLAO